jgi:hypothetical protein
MPAAALPYKSVLSGRLRVFVISAERERARPKKFHPVGRKGKEKKRKEKKRKEKDDDVIKKTIDRNGKSQFNRTSRALRVLPRD